MSTEPKQHVSWTTEDEIGFIASLRHDGMTHAELVELYADGAARRANWGTVNRAQVMEYLQAELRNAESLAAAAAFKRALERFRTGQA